MSRYGAMCAAVASFSTTVLLTTLAIAQDVQLDMATVDGNSQPGKFMATFAQIASDNVERVQISVYSDGIDTLDTMSLSRGVLDMSMVSPVTHDLMTVAGAMFARETVAAELSKTVKLLLWFPSGQFHFAVRADSDIRALDDIKGAKVYLGPHTQSAAFHNAQKWITATSGLTAGRDYEAIADKWDVGIEAFRSGEVDVFISACLNPCQRLEALSGSIDLRFIGPSSADGLEVDDFFRPGRSQTNNQSVMAKGIRSGNAVVSFQTVAGIAAYDTTDEQVVYDITKAFWENSERLSEAWPWADVLDINFAAAERGLIQLHPGAARYYREVGVID